MGHIEQMDSTLDCGLNCLDFSLGWGDCGLYNGVHHLSPLAALQHGDLD